MHLESLFRSQIIVFRICLSNILLNFAQLSFVTSTFLYRYSTSVLNILLSRQTFCTILFADLLGFTQFISLLCRTSQEFESITGQQFHSSYPTRSAMEPVLAQALIVCNNFCIASCYTEVRPLLLPIQPFLLTWLSNFIKLVRWTNISKICQTRSYSPSLLSLFHSTNLGSSAKVCPFSIHKCGNAQEKFNPTVFSGCETSACLFKVTAVVSMKPSTNLANSPTPFWHFIPKELTNHRSKGTTFKLLGRVLKHGWFLGQAGYI